MFQVNWEFFQPTGKRFVTGNNPVLYREKAPRCVSTCQVTLEKCLNFHIKMPTKTWSVNLFYLYNDQLVADRHFAQHCLLLLHH